jgi:phage terminase large subunit GpA-like protein
MVGANSPRGFRRVSRKVVIFDEVDGYPASAGPEGDQIKLGITRTQYYWDRKIIAGSTPTIAGRSRIESMFNEGDQRRYYVPCPECHEKQVLKMSQLKWKKDPMAAYYECEFCGFHVEHKHKRWMVENGEWRAHAVFTGHASFHIWAAYSYSPNATWGHIAAEFEAANKEGTEALKTFVNTVLGETWQDRGDAPDWQRLYDRREHYARGTVPRGGLFLTAGVDVQKDRIEWEVVAWGRGKRSWSIDYGVEPGDTAAPEVWKKLDELIGRRFTSETGVVMPIAIMSVDSGYESQTVYGWCRRYSMSRVIAIKGVSTGTLLIGAPSPVDVSIGGRRLARGYKVWPVSGSVAKSELYGWLRLEKPTVESGDAYPPGYCHFPEYGEEYFKGLTGEQLIAHKKRTGFVRMEWEKIPGRRNEPLDCRCYARAAAAVFGIDRMQETDWVRLERETAHVEPEKTQDVQRGSRPNDAQQPSAAAQPKSSWIPRRPGWINRG